MFDGPYASEEALRQAVEQKQAATTMVFFALLPDASGRAEGWASLMRPDPLTALWRWGILCWLGLAADHRGDRGDVPAGEARV